MLTLLQALLIAASAITLTTADNGRAIVVDTGSSVVLRLKANRTTGYQWVLAEKSRQCATVVRDDYRSGHSGLMGAGGTRVLTLRFDRPGKCAVRLSYLRPWQANAPADSFAVSVNVR
ncbi:MAG: hypothetical protein C0606_17795 [Hyphomicrobiales bacterium]|nr:MAG: hypothetical protein C0606_17795 [Hyphomicrobiales bacterium]